MTENNTDPGDTQGWAPPTGTPNPPENDPAAPVPRPDPYAQFGNPLHDTWGTQPQSVAPEASVRTVKQSKKLSRGARWGIFVVVLAALALAGWLARGPIVDAWDWVYDQADDLVSGDADSDDAASDPTAGSSTSAAAGSFDTAAEAEAAAFEDWRQQNAAELQRLGTNAQASSKQMLQFNESAARTGQVDPQAFQAALVAVRDDTLATVRFLDTAPQSAIRNDFVSILLVDVDGLNQMMAAVDSGSTSAVTDAGAKLIQAGNEIARLCRQYGNSAQGLC